MRHASISHILIATFTFFALAACDKKSDATPKAEHPSVAVPAAAVPEAAANEATHAHKGAQAGSHEDWCGAHQVPESLCSRCNPTLVVAFKATGDWCEEHGLPESQCLICNPDLKIERPPRTEETSP